MFFLCLPLDSAQIHAVWTDYYNNGLPAKIHTPLALKLDSAGNIYVAGSSQNVSNFYDYIVLKYAPEGAQLYAACYGATNGMDSTAKGFALDPKGNTYLTGTGGTVKFDTSGQAVWVAPYPGNDVAVDTNGNVYVTGFSTTEFATAKLTPSGSNLWVRMYIGTSSHDHPVAISQKVAVDEAGNVYVAGWTDTGPGWVYPGETNRNYYSESEMLKYNSAGGFL